MDPVVAGAFALLVLGVAGTVVPFVPGGLLSLAGVLAYWHHSGYTRPGALLLVALAATALLAVFVDYFGGAIGAKSSGTSVTHAVAASVAGIVGLLVGGPPGLLVGVVGTTYLLERREHGPGAETRKRALAAGLGVLASAVVQVALTGAVLLAMVGVATGVL